MKFREISGGNFREIPGNFSRKWQEIFSEFFCIFLVEMYCYSPSFVFLKTVKFMKFQEISEENFGKMSGNFSDEKFREEIFPEIFPRIFRDFPGMKHMLQP